MNHWRVRLAGEPFDLQELARWFPSGDVYVTQIEGAYYIAGKRFDTCGTADDVRADADLALREVFGVVTVCGSVSHIPKLSHVERLRDDGKTDYFLQAEPGVIRISAGVGSAGPPTTTLAQTFAARAADRPHAREALRQLSLQTSWGQLYRALEEIEHDLGKQVDAAGISTKADRVRFTRTANTAEVGGQTARHAGSKFTPPADPMTLAEGQKWIRNLLAKALQ
jgi:hypothetical protein